MPLTPEQRAERRTGIGGSDAAAVLGVHPHLTPLALYMSKVYDAPEDEESEAMRWGNLLEDVIRQEAANLLGQTVSVPDSTMRHMKSPIMLANVDGLLGDGRILECKGVSSLSFKTIEDDGIAGVQPHHYWQVQHYMEVTQAPAAVVAYLVGGQKMVLVEVERDPTVGAHLRREEERWWYKHVVAENPPADGTPQERLSLLDRVHAMQRKGMIQTDAESVVALARAYKQADAEIKAATRRKDECKADLAAIIGSDEGLDFGPMVGKVTYRRDKRGTRTMRVTLRGDAGDEE